MTLTLNLHVPRWAHVEGDAVFSEDRRCRYWLRRRWGCGPALMFVSLNPYGADEYRGDQIMRREMDFAKRLGYDVVTLLNLSAVVMTNPKHVGRVVDRIGPDNDAHLDREDARHDVIVFAWGSDADPARARAVARRLWNICRQTGGSVACLGSAVGGQPRHVSELANDTAVSTLTAAAHCDFVDVDPRWARLLADTDVLDECLQIVRAVDAFTGEVAATGSAIVSIEQPAVVRRTA